MPDNRLVLRVSLFGWPQVHICEGGRARPLPLPGNKPQAVLYYLLLAGGPVARETLMALLWPDADERRARTSLRNALYQLQKSLPLAALQVDRQQVALSARYRWDLDIDRWRALLQPPLTLENLRQAVDLYRGDFLEGFHVPHAPEFSHWHTVMAQHFRTRMLEALDQGIRLALKQGRWALAERLLIFAVGREPWREDFHYILLQVLMWQGKYTAALKQYRLCCQVLQEELQTEPGPELQALVHEIQRRRAHPPPCRVPSLPLPLVGRDDDLARVGQMLAEARLVTLVGPNGVGKTMLALALAHHQRHRWAQGVYFVGLEGVHDPALLLSRVAERFGLPTDPAAHLPQRLVRYLAERELLLVLDNLEPMPRAASLLAAWLKHAPGLRVLITTAQPLGLRHESVYAVQPLPCPPPRQHPAPETYPAGQLFLAFWQRFVPVPAPQPDDAPWIARLCRLLDGLPLALELAAMQLRRQSLPQLVAALEQDLDVLQAAWPETPSRHRSLRTLFTHLWQGLNNDERDALLRLSVFAGPFTAEEARDIARLTPSMLQHLLTRGWVQPAFHWEQGLVLHRVLRTYVREHLPADGHPLAEAHARHYLGWLGRLPAALTEDDLQAIRQRDADVRAAWLWAARQGAWALLAQALPAWHGYHELQGLFAEGARVFQHTLTLVENAPRDLRGNLYARAAALQVRHGALSEALRLAQQAVHLLADEAEARLFAQNVLGVVHLHLGDFRSGMRVLEDVVQEAQRLGLVHEHIKGLVNLSSAYLRTGRYAQVAEVLRRGLDLCRAHGDAEGVAFFQLHLGTLALLQARWDAAERHLRAALSAAEELERPYFALHAWLNLAMARTLQNAPAEAIAQAAREAVRLAQEMGDAVSEARALGWLAWAHHRKHDRAQAWRLLERAFQQTHTGPTPTRLHLMTIAAHMWAAQGELQRAAALAGYVAAHPATETPTRERVQALLHALGQPVPTEIPPEPPSLFPQGDPGVVSGSEPRASRG